MIKNNIRSRDRKRMRRRGKASSWTREKEQRYSDRNEKDRRKEWQGENKRIRGQSKR